MAIDYVLLLGLVVDCPHADYLAAIELVCFRDGVKLRRVIFPSFGSQLARRIAFENDSPYSHFPNSVSVVMGGHFTTMYGESRVGRLCRNGRTGWLFPADSGGAGTGHTANVTQRALKRDG
jgi:hypothetical protein